MYQFHSFAPDLCYHVHSNPGKEIGQVEEVLRQILGELKTQGQRLERLEKGQDELRQNQELLRQGLDSQGQRLERIEKRLDRLEKGQASMRKELKHIWDDIKKIDSRLTAQEAKARLIP